MSATVDENSPYRVILGRIHSLNPGLLADEDLIQALLLLLVAKQKHFIIRTPDIDIAKVLKQTVNVGCESLRWKSGYKNRRLLPLNINRRKGEYDKLMYCLI